MIDFSQKSYANLLAQQLARVTESVDKRHGSLIQTALGPEAYALEDAYMDLDQMQKNAYGLTATGEALDYVVATAGLSRYPATPAVRLGIFNVDIPVSSRFSTNNGADSVVFTATKKVSAGHWQLTCETPGAIGNAYSGSLLSITFVQGLTSAEMTDILVPGDDVETDEALRMRWRDHLTSKPFGGNVASYVDWISPLDGVGGVQVYPVWNGGGTVKCSIIGADFLPASPTLVDAVQTVIDPLQNSGGGYGLAPIGAMVTVGTPEEVSVNVDAAVVVAPGYAVEQLSPLITAAIDEYLLSIRKAWSTPTTPGTTNYSSVAYRARITSAILSVQGVLNVTSITLNGAESDVIFEETGVLQQVPILGMVTIHAD